MSNPLRKWTRPFRQFIANKIASPRTTENEKVARKRQKYNEFVQSLHSCKALLAGAEEAVRQGNRYESTRLLRLASICDAEETAAFCREHPEKALGQDYLAAEAVATVRENPRLFNLFRECALVGRFQTQLSPVQRSILKQVVELHQEQWQSGLVSQPSCARKAPDAIRLQGRVAVVMPRSINCDPSYIDHDIGYHFQLSASGAGLDATYFAADALTYKGTPDLARHLAELDQFLARTRPEFLLFDGNFAPNANTINPDHISELKRKYGFIFINVIGDWYDFAVKDFHELWRGVSDLSIGFHRYSLFYDRCEKQKVVIWPTLPYAPSSFRGCAPDHRDLGLVYIGSSTRDRLTFLEMARRSNIPTYSRIHQRLRKDAPDHAELAAIFGRAKMIFNNGWLPDGEDIITARVGESILSGALLFQEVGTPLDDYLIPYVHYIPVSNLHQFIAFSQFFLEEEALREKITRQAYDFWCTYYSNRQFWREIFHRLEPGQPP